MRRETSRTIAFVLSGFLLVLAIVADLYRQSMDFPDGHLTELDRAEQRLLTAFVRVSVLFAAGFGFAGLRSSPSRIPTRVIVFAYSAFVLILLMIDHYLRRRFDNGIGG